MTKDIVIVGLGGFGREVADVIADINRESPTKPPWSLIGFLDDAPSEKNIERAKKQGNSYLGVVRGDAVEGAPYFVVAINDGGIRRKLADRLEKAGWTPATLIHPRARLGTATSVREGSIVCAGVQLNTNVTVGRHVHVNPNVNVGHDAQLDDYVSINPMAAISGEVSLRQGTLVGAAAFIFQGVELGPWSVVGASACVLKSNFSRSALVGVPARPLNSAE